MPFIRRRRILRCGLETSVVSTRPLESVSTSANNWGGASQTIIELSKELDGELGDLREERNIIKARLREKAENFTNSSLEDQNYEEWTCSSNTARLALTASICAQATYQPHIAPREPRFIIDPIYSIGASMNGDVKATVLYLVHPRTIDSEMRAILVIAVRGSASLVDWVVNTNIKEDDSSDIVDTNVMYTASQGPKPPLLAHRGFLNSARELIPRILLGIKAGMSKTAGNVDLLFTGHSAGGAVATILYAHFLTHFPGKYNFLNSSEIRLSCITFGAPPIFMTDINTTLQQNVTRSVGNGIALSFITEGDPIPRMDKNYAQVLFRLLSQNSAELADLVDGESVTSGDTSHTASTDAQAVKYTQPTLKLPNCLLHRIGDTVVMSDANSNADGDLDLRVWNLREGELNGYIFANFFAHAMSLYRDLVAKLAIGDFNKSSEPQP